MMMLSVRPAYAKGILTGSKSVELRRTRPSIKGDQLTVIYASTPVQAVIGACTISCVESGEPQDLKLRYLTEAQISEDEFDRYFEEAEVAWALHLRQSMFFEQPVSLERLRASSVLPVQSWRFLDWRAFAALLTSESDRIKLGNLLASGSG
ncbi:hypothetical protein [Tessaracoccus massiliensis]|uniref:hypothetical protein n=1 Tax=Tessaracoccus massiliensis TaxID=1522311 RepID=UPI000590227B|nr:hypothetical protein [Tessaracoccus massiliensis]